MKLGKIESIVITTLALIATYLIFQWLGIWGLAAVFVALTLDEIYFRIKHGYWREGYDR